MSDIKPTAELRFLYRNHRGKTAWRHVAPKFIRWGTSEHHPEPQWLLEAHDIHKGADRTFALKSVVEWQNDDDWKLLLNLPWSAGVVDDVEWLRGYSQRSEQRYLAERSLRLAAERRAADLVTAVRRHRDERGDDRCWMDDERLYDEALPEGCGSRADRRLHCPGEMLQHCRQFIISRQPGGEPYVSPQRDLDRFRAALEQIACRDQGEVGPHMEEPRAAALARGVLEGRDDGR